MKKYFKKLFQIFFSVLGPTVQCDFEHPYQCGYYSLDNHGRWHRGQVVEYSDLNVGPTVDNTFANNSGMSFFTGICYQC